jgi:CRISPR-associated protein Cmr6
LIIDIVNNHHPEYYSAAESDNAHPPGDWENPKPVYFAAVAPGAAFEFAVTKRRANASDEMLDLARQWLAGALCNSGAGAKTNAGYGAFDANSISDAVLKEACDKTWSEAIDKKASRVQLDCTIELITPAFLAGANHDDPSECDLRSATLRGQLRWWWRTMHSGHVDSATLRRMEAAIWGDSKHGGAVRIIVEPEGLRNYELFEKRNKSALKRHEKCEQYGIRQANDPNKVTPGVAYLAYGMDEIRDGQPSQRYALMPGMKWSIRLIARPTEALSSEMILEQAKAALWLLSSYGGVGSKCRKGFGSLTTDRFPEYSIQMCEVGSSQVRRTLGYSGNRQLTPDGSSLTHRVEIPAVVFPWNDVWAVIEQVGFAYQSFAKRYSHRLSKTALGLPRRTRANANDRFEPTGAFKQHWDKTPTRDRLEKLRFASPIHFHFERIHGGFVVKAIAFVQSTLPNTQASKMILDEFVQEMETELQCRAKLPPRSVAGSSSQPSKASTSTEGVRRATPTVNIPEIAHDQLKDRLANTQLPHVLLKASQTTTGEKCPCQLLKLAPKVPAGWQTVGDWQLADAPPGLPEGTIVLAVTENRIAKFQEVVGRLPSLQKNTGSKLPGNRRR